MERVRYPWWISPFFGVMALILVIPTLGGPGPILAATVTHGVLLAALASVAAGVLGMLAAEWWSRRIEAPSTPADATRRGKRRLAVLFVGVVVGGIVLQSASESPSPIFRAVAFGLLGGLSLGGAIVLPFDKRRSQKFELPPEDRRA